MARGKERREREREREREEEEEEEDVENLQIVSENVIFK